MLFSITNLKSPIEKKVVPPQSVSISTSHSSRENLQIFRSQFPPPLSHTSFIGPSTLNCPRPESRGYLPCTFFFHKSFFTFIKMADTTGVAAEAERFAIGISFGNTSSSIARISPVRCEISSHLLIHRLTHMYRRARLRLSPTRRVVCSEPPCFQPTSFK